jgi:pimeloyl-ACP methyl ester carboxylesterase
MIDFQTRFIFPTHAVRDAGPLPRGAETLSFKVRGAELAGVHFPPDRKSAERTLVLGLGGNGWNGQDVGEYLHELYPDADVIAFHYRGYRPSTGAPSADALIADAPLVYDFAVDRVKPAKAVAVGFSIGTGIAAQLASRRKLDGLILVTPFDSLKAVAQAMYPWLPIGIFFQHEVDAVAAIAKTKAPVAIVEAERDELVPHERTEALRKRVPNLVFDKIIRRAGHNDIYTRSEFQDAMREALRKVSR